MSAIKLNWGGWNIPSQRRYVASEIEPAVDVAEDYVEKVLEIERTAQRLGIYRGERGRNFARGGSASATALELYITKDEIKRRKLGAIFSEIATTLIHELVHCTRVSLFPDKRLIELIASEGLAYYAQASSYAEVFDVPLQETIIGHTDLDLHGEYLVHTLYGDKKLDEPVAESRKGGATQSRYVDQWLRCDSEGFPNCGLLGTWCVRSWIDDYGYDFATLMTMPAEELIAA